MRIYLHDTSHFKLDVTSDVNSYYLLDRPLVYGDYAKTLIAKKFEFPRDH